MATGKLKNNKIKKSEIGSEGTIHRRQKTNKLNNSKMARASNPGGATHD